MVADRVPAFVRFATDTLKNVANEINTGQQPQVKPAIIKAAAKHYPIILKVKGTLYAKPMKNPSYQVPSNGVANENTNESSYQGETVLNEMQEMELASELLSVRNDQELDMFLGNLFKKVTGAVSNFANSGIGKSLGGMLKSVAGKALPVLGGVLGSAIPIPGVGTMLGSALGSAAGKMFGLELEGLSGEDREFEVAKSFVRLSYDAAKRAARMRNMPPRQAARVALIRAARTYAPGLIRLRRPPNYGYSPTYINYNPGYAYAVPPPPGYGNYNYGYGTGIYNNNGGDSDYSNAGMNNDMNPSNADMNGGADMNPEVYEGNW